MHRKLDLSLIIYTYGFIFVCALLSSCIDEYTPQNIHEIRGILIVDGYITNGESAFTLQKSVGLTDQTYDQETIDNATLNVECSDGTIMPGVFTESGKYRVQTGDLFPDREYRLSFSFDGEVYQSEYLSPILTAEIDSLSYTKEKRGKPVYIHVSTHDPQNNSPYYRWTYSETWEVKAQLLANARQEGNEPPHFYYLNTSDNIYYCWGREESHIMLLESTEKLAENVVYQKRLYKIPSDDEKLSILYHVVVSQMQIREEAYAYFAMLRNTAERTGGIFSPILSAGLDGNIQCLTDPGIPVIGYMEVATTSKKAIYVDDRINLYEPPQTLDCPEYPPTNWNDYLPWYQYLVSRTERKCIDCRMKKNASKDKPDWWPTDHL